MIGITLDNPWVSDLIVNTLSKLYKKIHVRVVFDMGVNLSQYVEHLDKIKPYATIMAQVLDSSDMSRMPIDQFSRRCLEMSKLFSNYVDIWEIGNEVNGDWLGEDVIGKITLANNILKGPKAITLYADDNETYYDWIEVNQELIKLVDYVFISEYPQDNNHHRVDLNRFATSLKRFGVRYGYGECGTDNPRLKSKWFMHYYQDIAKRMSSDPGWVGGYFWWYQKDFISKGVLLNQLKIV